MPPKPKRRADWLKDKIEASRRDAIPGQCPRCKRPVIVGNSDDDFYWQATVDPLPVEAIDEAVARTAGRMSYDLVKRHTRQRLYVRGLHNLAHRQFPVLVDHVCDGRTVVESDWPEPKQVSPVLAPEGLF